MLNAARRPITPRGLPISEEAGQPFAALQVARTLLHTAATGSLSTLDPESGYPYATATNLVIEPDGTPCFFAAWLALHARNMDRDARVALSLSTPGARDMMTSPRLTLVGRAERVVKEEAGEIERRYVMRFPKSKLYLSLPDALLYRLRVEDLQLNGGPARNAVTDVTPETLKVDLTGAEVLMAGAWEVVERLNATPGETSRLAVLAGAAPGTWRVTGIDPDGLDLASREGHARLWFAARVVDQEGLAAALAR